MRKAGEQRGGHATQAGGEEGVAQARQQGVRAAAIEPDEEPAAVVEATLHHVQQARQRTIGKNVHADVAEPRGPHLDLAIDVAAPRIEQAEVLAFVEVHGLLRTGASRHRVEHMGEYAQFVGRRGVHALLHVRTHRQPGDAEQRRHDQREQCRLQRREPEGTAAQEYVAKTGRTRHQVARAPGTLRSR